MGTGITTNANYKKQSRLDDRLMTSMADKKVLVVEDDPFSQKFFQKVISDNYKNVGIVFARDYESALRAYYLHGGFDMVILDIFLEGRRSGVELYKTLREITSSTSFIMTSALEPENYRELFDEDLNPPPYLQKPFQPEECAELVNVFMKGDAS